MTFMQKVKLFFSKVGDFLTPLVKLFASEAGKVVADAALKAVSATAQYAFDNDEAKRKNAYDLILADLKYQGIKVSTSMVNAAIEAAVIKMKEQ
jgi:hypothetical protein